MQCVRRFFRSLLQLLQPIFFLWQRITADWHIYLEQPVPVEELAVSREAASIPSFGYFFMLICADVLATLGLFSNSAAVIIGAMIVAPLMNPMLSMAFGIVTANWKLYQRSIITVALGAITTVLVSYGLTFLIPIKIVGSEIITRTSPNLIDLGIAIAAGAAGAFSLTRSSIANSIAGVAIAVALVPPLCVTGIGLGIGSDIGAEIGQTVVSNINVASGSFLLFLANLIGITLTACIIFLTQAYGNLYKSFQTLTIWVFIMVLLTVPLSNALAEFIIAKQVNFEFKRIRDNTPQLTRQVTTQFVDVAIEGKVIHITVIANAPKGLLTDELLESIKDHLFDFLSQRGMQEMSIDIRIVPVEIRQYRALSN